MTSTTAHQDPAVGEQSVELSVGGMTCASCAARVEKKLNRMDGVSASVNYATEKAKITYAGGVSLGDLIATVERTGYSARPPETPAPRRRRDRRRNPGRKPRRPGRPGPSPGPSRGRSRGRSPTRA